MNALKLTEYLGQHVPDGWYLCRGRDVSDTRDEWFYAQCVHWAIGQVWVDASVILRFVHSFYEVAE